jgi:anthraniloyl-CoA monooxygenase
MGDAAHTAHFSIGSCTKLALEDAIALARDIAANPGDLAGALKAYEAARSVEVLRIQNAARNSTEWFENVARYATLPPQQFAYSLLTRSQRISHENLRLRDRTYVEDYEDWIAERAGVSRRPAQGSIPPMFTPFTLRGVTLKNRVVVSHRRRLPPRPPVRAGHGRRGPRVRRDDLRVARCSHHPRLPGPVERRPA